MWTVGQALTRVRGTGEFEFEFEEDEDAKKRKNCYQKSNTVMKFSFLIEIATTCT